MVTSELPGGVKAGALRAPAPPAALTPPRRRANAAADLRVRPTHEGRAAREKPRRVCGGVRPDGIAPYFQIGAARGITGTT